MIFHLHPSTFPTTTLKWRAGSDVRDWSKMYNWCTTRTGLVCVSTVSYNVILIGCYTLYYNTYFIRGPKYTKNVF